MGNDPLLRIKYYDTKYAKNPIDQIYNLSSLLNRCDIFADFTTKSSVALEWAAPKDVGIGCWNLIWQVIIARELANRMDRYPSGYIPELTPRLIASLIVSDLWLRSVEVVLTNQKVSIGELKRAATSEARAKAEDFKLQGNKALAAKLYQRAADLYTKAIEVNATNAIYRANRSAALLSLKDYDSAHRL